MREKTRNFIVGLTVLIGLVLLGSMIVIFRELPPFLRLGSYDVKVHFKDAAGVTPGADVLMVGKRVGRVTSVNFADRNNPGKGIIFTLAIERDVQLPGDVNVYIVRGFAGFAGALIDLRLDGRPLGSERKDPDTGEKLASIPRDRVITIEGAKEPPAGGAQMIPPELIDDARSTMGSIKRLSDKLNDFFAAPEPATTTGPAQPGAPSEPVRPRNIHEILAKLETALAAVNKILGDRETQANFKAALEGFKTAAAASEEAMHEVKAMAATAKQTLTDVAKAAGATSKVAADTAAKFQDLAAGLLVSADRLGTALTALQRTLAKAESGRGTAAKLLNDPALYNSLVDAVGELEATLIRLQELIRTWKERGLKVRLW